MTAPAAESVTANPRARANAVVTRHVEPATDNTLPDIRPLVIRNTYQTLAGFALERDRERWVHCSVCDGKSFDDHCLTCHQEPTYRTSAYDGSEYPTSPDHGSCFACGRCLPRGSRRYMCSSTCRVRAFNYYHHTPEGRARREAQEQRNAEWMAAFAEKWGGGVSEERKRRREAAHDARICGRCGVDLAPGAPVYRQQLDVDWTSVCEGCRWDWPHWRGPFPCRGCERPVFVYPQRVRYKWSPEGKWEPSASCSRRCTQDAAYRRQKLRRATEREPIECATCHERMDPLRRDARYCSNACRQRAYRARRTA